MCIVSSWQCLVGDRCSPFVFAYVANWLFHIPRMGSWGLGAFVSYMYWGMYIYMYMKTYMYGACAYNLLLLDPYRQAQSEGINC